MKKKKKTSELDVRNQELGNKNQELETDNSKLNVENSELSSENSVLKQNNSKLEEEKNNLSKEKESLGVENSNLSKENENLGKENQDLSKENEGLKKKLATMEQGILDNGQENDKLNQENEKLQEMLDKKEKELQEALKPKETPEQKAKREKEEMEQKKREEEQKKRDQEEYNELKKLLEESSKKLTNLKDTQTDTNIEQAKKRLDSKSQITDESDTKLGPILSVAFALNENKLIQQRLEELAKKLEISQSSQLWYIDLGQKKAFEGYLKDKNITYNRDTIKNFIKKAKDSGKSKNSKYFDSILGVLNKTDSLGKNEQVDKSDVGSLSTEGGVRQSVFNVPRSGGLAKNLLSSKEAIKATNRTLDNGNPGLDPMAVELIKPEIPAIGKGHGHE